MTLGTQTAKIEAQTEKWNFQCLLETLSSLNIDADEVSELVQEKVTELVGAVTLKVIDNVPDNTNGILGACFESAQSLRLRLCDIRDQISRL